MGEVYLAQHPRLPRRDALKVLSAAVSATANTGSGSTARPTSRPRCGIRTSSRCTTVASSTASCGSRWTTSRAPTPAGCCVRAHPDGCHAEKVVAIVDRGRRRARLRPPAGLLHRDVKPANILMAHPATRTNSESCWPTSGSPAGMTTPSGLTATNMTVGTVAYAAPEQLMGEDARRARRPVRAGGHRLSPADRRAAVPAFQPGGRHQPAPDRGAAGYRRTPPRTVRARSGVGQGAVEGSQGPLRPVHRLRARARPRARRGADR